MKCLGGTVNKIQIESCFDYEWEFTTSGYNCPECGGIGSSNGKFRLRCTECGRQWMKEYRPKTSFNNRPNCPRCGEKPKSHGRHWECRKCGKMWIKDESYI